jgi:hypothetical protein
MVFFNYTIQFTDGEDKGLCVERVEEFENMEDLQLWSKKINMDDAEGAGEGFKVICINQ